MGLQMSLHNHGSPCGASKPLSKQEHMKRDGLRSLLTQILTMRHVLVHISKTICYIFVDVQNSNTVDKYFCLYLHIVCTYRVHAREWGDRIACLTDPEPK